MSAYSPLGRGLLTGAVRATTSYDSGDFHAAAPRCTGDNLKANPAVVDALTQLAAAKNAWPGSPHAAATSSPSPAARAARTCATTWPPSTCS
ncbi:hypothetical protein [Streptomyces broussonetiae]|uniref:hypothetical protein n=1 Tax=Streptomyces broussonetiae TaxID=2686304 RepID=UPI0035D84F7D